MERKYQIQYRCDYTGNVWEDVRHADYPFCDVGLDRARADLQYRCQHLGEHAEFRIISVQVNVIE